MADMIPLNAVRAAIDAISTGRPANALENLRVLEIHLRAQIAGVQVAITSGVEVLPEPATPLPQFWPGSKPVEMILHCPRCHLQHIDEPRHPGIGCRREVPQTVPNADGGDPVTRETWMNPPHRSHLCAGCGLIWRPADVPTTGVAAIHTRGEKDDQPSAPYVVNALDASIIKEAGDLLEEIGANTRDDALPDTWRWPLVDELHGIAAIMSMGQPRAST